MENVHLAPDGDEDDLYSGYEYSTIANELEEDPEFQRVIKTGYGYANRPMLATGAGLKTGAPGFLPPPTAGRGAMLVPPQDAQARPMTGVTAAGFSSSKKQQFDPLSQATKRSLPGMEKINNSPQATIKKLEKLVNQLIEESTQAAAAGDYETALAKAKKAGNKERMLCKEREQNNATDQINFDLTYCVLFNIGNQYYANKNYRDALNTYLIIVKNKMFNTGGSRLRINIGNIYMDQKKYPQAIKNYRMALDQTSDTHRAIRLKILQNIGIAFVRMGRYSDAITSFENIMDDEPNFKTALNLILCYYAISDREKLKRTFQRTLSIPTGGHDEERYYLAMDEDPQQRLLHEAIKDDTLRKIENERQKQAEKIILTTAKLIAPVIESSFAVGFDWCIENVMESRYSDLASELEITKGLTYLKQSDIPKAIETFKDCGKKDNKMAGSAAINLAFIYILEGDIVRGEKCADKAISLDHYNPLGLVNKGCCLYINGEYEKSTEYFQEALNVEATCCEALFNLGLAYKKMESLGKAMDTFLKLHAILKNSPQVLYHLGDIYDKMNDFPHASEWFMQLVTLVPTDPHILMRLGAIHDDNNDPSQAYQYHYESFRYCPTNISVISWLGAYYMDSQYADKAIHYFEKAALIQPTQVKWQLMVASCYRKTGNYQRALQIYKQIHIKFPDDIDCLKFLVKLCSDLRLKEVQEYSLKLKKAEKLMDSKKQRESLDNRSKLSVTMPSRNGGVNSVDSDSSTQRQAGSPMTPSRSRFHQPDTDRLTSGGSIDSRDSSSTKRREVDATYQDPIGELQVRRLASGSTKQQKDDDFDDDELGDDLLPE